MSSELKPEVVVGAFIRDSDGNILLVKSYKWPGLWVVGGGHIEYGEKISEALEREVMEEYSLRVDFKRVIKVIEFINDPQFINSGRHFVGLQCECIASNPEEIKLDDKELQEYKWFTLKEAIELKDIVEVTRITIEDLYKVEHDKN